MKKLNASKSAVKNLPEGSGVYIFENSQGQAIYVGKAKNLKSRVSSYFAGKLSPKTAQMIKMSENIGYIPTASEFEALLLEAKLVKKFQPKYNSELRDDKSPLYIGITKEEYPRVLTLRQTQLEKYKLREYFGPFLSATAPRKVLRRLRRAIPYSTHKPGRRACVYNEIGLCDPCPSEIKNLKDDEEKSRKRREYLKNISKIKRILSGNINTVKKEMSNRMKKFADNQEFENAQKLLEQIRALEYVTSDTGLKGRYLKNPNLLEDVRQEELEQLKSIVNQFIDLESLERIECFDVAHLAGTYPTASMVTFVNGEPDKSYYRHFRMHNDNSDTDNMKEVLRRRKARFNKKDWGMPDLIIVDGGKGQVSVASDALDGQVPVIGLAKREETLIFKTKNEYKERKLPNGPAKYLVQRIRNEAHRFARRYHHKLVSKAITSSKMSV